VEDSTAVILRRGPKDLPIRPRASLAYLYAVCSDASNDTVSSTRIYNMLVHTSVHPRAQEIAVLITSAQSSLRLAHPFAKRIIVTSANEIAYEECCWPPVMWYNVLMIPTSRIHVFKLGQAFALFTRLTQ